MPATHASPQFDLSRYTQEDIDFIRSTIGASGMPSRTETDIIDQILGPDPRVALVAAWDRKQAGEPEPPAADAGQSARRSRAEQARINGAKSRGPATEAGKAASSRNAVKHGLTSRFVLLADEDRPAFDAHVAGYRDALRPAGAIQEDLCRRAAELAWRLRRMPAMEATLYTDVDELEQDPTAYREQVTAIEMLAQIAGKSATHGCLNLLQRYETRLERSLQACLKEIRTLKAMAGEEAAREGSIAPGSFGTATLEPAPGSFGTATADPVVDALVKLEAAPPAAAPASPTVDRPKFTPPPAPGSFGTASPMIPPIATLASAAASAVSGSFGKPQKAAAWPVKNEVLPTLVGRP